MFRLSFLIVLSLAVISQAIGAESSNINKIRNMDYDYNQRVIAEDIIRRLDNKNSNLVIYDGHMF